MTQKEVRVGVRLRFDFLNAVNYSSHKCSELYTALKIIYNSQVTATYLCCRVPEFIEAQNWPPCSSEISTAGLSRWRSLQENDISERCETSISEVACFVTVLGRISQKGRQTNC